MQRFPFFAPTLLGACVLGLLACGGSTPISAPSGGNGGMAEVPRDQDDGQGATKPPATSQPPTLVVEPTPVAPDNNSLAAPKPVETTAAQPPIVRSKSKANGKVSQKECSDMIDRYLDLTIAGPGGPLAEMSGKELEQGKAQLKALAANDKAFAGLQTTCEKTATRSQYDCAMNAPNSRDWQACVR